MRHENHINRRARNFGQFLFDFRFMLMRCDFIGGQVLVTFREMVSRFGSTSRAGDTGFAIHENRRGFD